MNDQIDSLLKRHNLVVARRAGEAIVKFTWQDLTNADELNPFCEEYSKLGNIITKLIKSKMPKRACMYMRSINVWSRELAGLISEMGEHFVGDAFEVVWFPSNNRSEHANSFIVRKSAMPMLNAEITMAMNKLQLVDLYVQCMRAETIIDILNDVNHPRHDLIVRLNKLATKAE